MFFLSTLITVSSTCTHTCTCRFRRQHEQLRQVIVRVLRPTTTKPTQAGTPGQEEVDVKVVKPLVDEVADANAIEVRQHWLYVLDYQYIFSPQALIKMIV